MKISNKLNAFINDTVLTKHREDIRNMILTSTELNVDFPLHIKVTEEQSMYGIEFEFIVTKFDVTQ